MKYFWGGKQVLMKRKPELLNIDKDIQKYDFLFIGTPVWAWTYSSPLNTFFSKYSFFNKKIALFCCHGGSKGRIFDKMKKNMKNNQIIGQIDFHDPLKTNTEYNIYKAIKWSKQILALGKG